MLKLITILIKEKDETPNMLDGLPENNLVVADILVHPDLKILRANLETHAFALDRAWKEKVRRKRAEEK